MQIVAGNWRVVPCDSHCWQLQHRVAGEGKREWGKGLSFPSSLHHAIEMLWEKAVRDAPGEYDLKDRDALLKGVASLKSEFVEGTCKTSTGSR